MSPELLDPGKLENWDPRPTKRSDRYALGIIIYEVCVHNVCLPRLLHPY